MRRYLFRQIEKDLKQKMVFLGGPRQVGKTTLALDLLGATEEDPAYFNYDDDEDRERLFAGKWPERTLVVLDEIHKYRAWRNWLKGKYDKSKSQRRFLVTGSARLDLYRRSGDSLFGRHHYLRLHPFSVAELRSAKKLHMRRLLERGGFPEPYFAGEEVAVARWRRERRNLVFRHDLRDLERVYDLAKVELLAQRLNHLVGSPLSINALAEDLQVAHKTVAHWIEILERLYHCYRVYPYGTDRIRAVKKEAKLYLWDWGEVPDPGFRFENCVASHLLKFCHFKEDTEGKEMELRYLRDTDAREVDFVVLENERPIFAVECKLTEARITKPMRYFRERTKIPRFHLVHSGTEHFVGDDPGFEVVGAEEFLGRLV
jgi:predicted AAA+ superfamily ATPase